MPSKDVKPPSIPGHFSSQDAFPNCEQLTDDLHIVKGSIRFPDVLLKQAVCSIPVNRIVLRLTGHYFLKVNKLNKASNINILPPKSSIPLIAYRSIMRSINIKTWMTCAKDLMMVSKTTFKFSDFEMSLNGRSIRNSRKNFKLNDLSTLSDKTNTSEIDPGKRKYDLNSPVILVIRLWLPYFMIGRTLE